MAKETVKETIASPIVGTAEDKDGRSRKSSEPPPSLQALFDHDMGSSRRMINKQHSADHVHVAHPKQHSLDSTHLKSTTPQSPKLHTRRVKSPSTSDKNNRIDLSESGRIPRTPSHPHLNSPLSTTHITKLHTNDPPMVRAHSTQQLQDIHNEDDSNSSHNRFESLQVDSSLKNSKDREIYQSKESLKDSGLLKMQSLTVSHESLVSNESVTVKEMTKESVVERVTSSKVQDVESSSESSQAPSVVSPQKQPIDLKRRNSSLLQYGVLKDSDGAEFSGKKRPRCVLVGCGKGIAFAW